MLLEKRWLGCQNVLIYGKTTVPSVCPVYRHVWVCIAMMKDGHLDKPDEYLEKEGHLAKMSIHAAQ